MNTFRQILIKFTFICCLYKLLYFAQKIISSTADDGNDIENAQIMAETDDQGVTTDELECVRMAEADSTTTTESLAAISVNENRTPVITNDNISSTKRNLISEQGISVSCQENDLGRNIEEESASGSSSMVSPNCNTLYQYQQQAAVPPRQRQLKGEINYLFCFQGMDKVCLSRYTKITNCLHESS